MQAPTHDVRHGDRRKEQAKSERQGKTSECQCLQGMPLIQNEQYMLVFLHAHKATTMRFPVEDAKPGLMLLVDEVERDLLVIQTAPCEHPCEIDVEQGLAHAGDGRAVPPEEAARKRGSLHPDVLDRIGGEFGEGLPQRDVDAVGLEAGVAG